MTETSNEPPAGQVWDPVLRQWTGGGRRLVAYMNWKERDSVDPGWIAAENGWFTTADGSFQNNLVILDDSIVPAAEQSFASDIFLQVSTRGILTCMMQAQIFELNGTPADLTGFMQMSMEDDSIYQGISGGALVGTQGADPASTAEVLGALSVSAYIDPTFLDPFNDGHNLIASAIVACPATATTYMDSWLLQIYFEPL